jgi:hypothetical protein
MPWGDIPVRVSWHSGDVTFCHLEIGDAPAAYPAKSTIVELGELMPQSSGKRSKSSDAVDPLLSGSGKRGGKW